MNLFTSIQDKFHIRKSKDDNNNEAKRIQKLKKQQEKRYRRMANAPGQISTCFMFDTYMTEEDKARLRKKIAELNNH